MNNNRGLGIMMLCLPAMMILGLIFLGTNMFIATLFAIAFGSACIAYRLYCLCNYIDYQQKGY